MRSILTLIFITIIFSINGQEYKIEKQLFECLISVANNHGIDLKQEFNDFETHLIERKVLKDRSSDSYYQIYKRIENEGEINFDFHYSLLDTIKLHSKSIDLHKLQLEYNIESSKILNRKDYKKSKVCKLNIAMDSIEKTENIDVGEIAKTITQILTPKDFEQDYYKINLLLILNATQEFSSKQDGALPTKEVPIKKYSQKERNILNIHVSANPDSVLFNKKALSINDIPLITKEYILSDKNDTLKPELTPTYIENIGECYQSELTIILSNDRDAMYLTYVTVQDKLIKGYEIARDDLSKKHFNKPFNELSDPEKKAMMELVPIRIMEPESNQN